MFPRRAIPGRIGRRGVLKSGAFSGNFAALFTGAGLTVVQYLRSDLGVTGSPVTAWADQSASGANISPGTSATSIGAVTTGLNGHAGIAGGVALTYGQFTLALAAPGTTPFMYWGVLRQLAVPAAQGFLVGDGTNAGDCYAQAAASLNIFNGTAVIGPVATGLNTWGVLQARFSNSASDFIKFGSNAAVTGNPGNTTPIAARGLFESNNAGASLGNFEILTLLTMTGSTAAYASVLAPASAAAVSLYGASVNI